VHEGYLLLSCLFVIILARCQAQMRAADAWGAGLLLVLKIAIWNDDRTVRDRARARYYELRPDYLGSVRRFTEALAQYQAYSPATAYFAL
jgi:hypothetical protein